MLTQKLLLRNLGSKRCLCLYNSTSVTSTNSQYVAENTEASIAAPKLREDIPYMPTSKRKLQKYLSTEPNAFKMLPYIPKKHVTLVRRDSIENLYLIDSEIAKHAVDQIFPIIQKNKRQLVCETNAGLALISSELLDRGLPLVRLYEVCPDFRAALKEFNTVYPRRVELFTKDIYHAYALKYLDNIDNGSRIEQLLRDVPKKDWTDEPVISIIGPMANMKFIKYLIRTLALQTDLAKYGRPQIFAFMTPRDYSILTANADNNLHTYQFWSVLFNLLFDWKFLQKYTRKAFLPWEQNIKFTSRTRYATKRDVDQMYFVQLELKRQLPVEPDKVLHLFYFVRHFYGRGTNRVIPTLEKYFPGLGLNIFLPECEHNGTFPRNVDLYTTFGQLHPYEILGIFKEFINHPDYSNSPFLSIVESHLIKTETVESDMVIEGELDKDTIEEIEEKFLT